MLVGTYSSVFVASPLVVEWEALRERPRLKRAGLVAVVVLALAGLGGLVTQSILTAHEYEREDACAKALDTVNMALGNYAAKHVGEYPKDLRALVPAGALADEAALYGPDKDAGVVAYDYISGLRSSDDPNSLLLYDRRGLHSRGGHVLFVDGRVDFKDRRNIAALVAATTEKLRKEPGRKIEIRPAVPPAPGD